MVKLAYIRRGSGVWGIAGMNYIYRKIWIPEIKLLTSYKMFKKC